MRPRPENPLIVAIDVSEMAPAVALAEALAPHAAMLKVGLELFWARGPEAVRAMAERGPVFVDCKLHDIPTTVERRGPPRAPRAAPRRPRASPARGSR